MKSVAKFGIVSVLLLALFAIVGCSNAIPQLVQARETAQVVLDQTKGAAGDVQSEINKLPPNDPVRVQLEGKLRQLNKVLDQAQQAVVTAGAAIEAAETGTVSPELSAVLAGVPYGTYAIAAISVVLALKKRAEALKVSGVLRKVVQSWDDVGPDLTPEEKKEVAKIQGPEASDLVSAIKADIAAK